MSTYTRIKPSKKPVARVYCGRSCEVVEVADIPAAQKKGEGGNAGASSGAAKKQ